MTAPQRVASPATPQEVVETFLAALAADDIPAAGTLLAEDVRYVNVGLPTIRTRGRTVRVLEQLSRRGLAFEVYLHAVAADGSTVLTERTDVLLLGPIRLQFWVTGRFDVRDGQIALWRDSFDYLDMTRSLLRGIVGAAVPALRPKPPSSAATPPGRH
jgi:limonene-1,2-epoxide hydrolase